jgi:hypothetical protein
MLNKGRRMRLKVGIMGDARRNCPKAYRELAYRLGVAIAENNCVAVTGAGPGLPFEAARGVKDTGGLVVGISPALSQAEHAEKYGSPTQYHDILIYTGSGLMGREVINIRTSDIVVIVGGRSGTLGEFSIAYDEGKLIGVLMGTGGVTREIGNLVKHIKKQTGARIIYDSRPGTLIERLLAEHRRRSRK